MHTHGGVLNGAVYRKFSGTVSHAALHHLAIASEISDLRAA